MEWDAARKLMVDTQLIPRGITDPAVIKAMREVPRHEFVPVELRDIAYSDCPLPIGEGQTISQPYIVALMTQALEPGSQDVVLEIGAGSGYQAAVLSRIVKQVYSVERKTELVEQSQQTLRRLSYLNVKVSYGDGSQGHAKRSPYDAIIVTAACKRVPEALTKQLKEGGRMVIPVGARDYQSLMKYAKENGVLVGRKLCDCAFVPLISEDGFEE